MKSRIFYAAWALTALLMVAAFPWLPAELGDPGKRLSREAFMLTNLASVALAGLCSKAFVMWLGQRMPDAINVPHRQHWMAPPLRGATLNRLGEHASGMGVLLLLLLMGAFAASVLGAQPQWPQPPVEAWWAGGGALLLAALAWCRQAYRLFPAPAPQAPDAPARQPRRPRAPG